MDRLASAVSVPDKDTVASPPDQPLKRKSSVTDPDTKRRRLSSHDDQDRQETNGAEKEQPELAADRRRFSTEAAPEPQEKGRKPVRRDEERKRGQRLFGALLGTLSQSSNSAAQKRRADIERRQQDKLKLQDEEYGEVKKKRREERMVIRKREQRDYEEEAVCCLILWKKCWC